jgi:VIT1/CCC1 family predicted Fe2+/Mn2+ transporter
MSGSGAEPGRRGPAEPAMGASSNATSEALDSGAMAVASIRDVILGGQDGLVNVLGLVLGLAVATGDGRVIVTAALAAMFAESIAMAGVAYTSRGAERDFASDARADLLDRLAARASERLADRRAALERAGVERALIDTILAAASEESAAWRDGFDRLERSLAPVREAHPLRAAIVVGLSTIVGSAVPLVPFLLLPVGSAMVVAVRGGGPVSRGGPAGSPDKRPGPARRPPDGRDRAALRAGRLPHRPGPAQPGYVGIPCRAGPMASAPKDSRPSWACPAALLGVPPGTHQHLRIRR